MPHITHFLPELDPIETDYIEDLVNALSREQALIFATAYRLRRKDPHTVLLAGVVGLAAIPGFQRFWLGQVRFGFLYLITWGFLLVGSIVDVFRYRTLAFKYNQEIARQIVTNIQRTDLSSGSPFRHAALQHA
jgi:TM2 domain-containing membrane protein YozV